MDVRRTKYVQRKSKRVDRRGEHTRSKPNKCDVAFCWWDMVKVAELHCSELCNRKNFFKNSVTDGEKVLCLIHSFCLAFLRIFHFIAGSTLHVWYGQMWVTIWKVEAKRESWDQKSHQDYIFESVNLHIAYYSDLLRKLQLKLLRWLTNWGLDETTMLDAAEFSHYIVRVGAGLHGTSLGGEKGDVVWYPFYKCRVSIKFRLELPSICGF